MKLLQQIIDNTLDQCAYLKNISNKFNMLDCKSTSTPIESKLNSIALNSDKKYDVRCRNVLGWLMYIALCSWPD